MNLRLGEENDDDLLFGALVYDLRKMNPVEIDIVLDDLKDRVSCESAVVHR